MSSWLNPTSVLGGVLAVLTCGYLAAVFLSAEAHREGEPDLVQWARRRAVVAAVATGAVAIAGLFVLRDDAPRLGHQLVDRAWPLIVLSALAGWPCWSRPCGPIGLPPAAVRPLGALAVAAVLGGWGTAQYPYLLGTHLDLHDAAAPAATMTALAVVAVLALVLVVPSLVWLLLLTHRGHLVGSDD